MKLYALSMPTSHNPVTQTAIASGTINSGK
jgi:hypothetical protein